MSIQLQVQIVLKAGFSLLTLNNLLLIYFNKM